MKMKRFRGFTLLEVMIAVLVLSLGLLGLAGLQAYSMRNNQSANYRTQATNLAYQFIDTARGYRGAANPGQDARNHPNIRRLVAGLNSFSDGGNMSLLTACTGAGAGVDPIRCDRARWFNALRTQLPNGRARVVFAGMPSGTLTVEICWTDDRSVTATQTTDCTNASEGYGRASIGADGTSDWPNNAVWLRSSI